MATEAVSAELDAALLHHELIVAALQSHARLAEIEKEYQRRLSAFWDEAKAYSDAAVSRAVAAADAEIIELRDRIVALNKRKPAAKKKPALKAKKKRKASK